MLLGTLTLLSTLCTPVEELRTLEPSIWGVLVRVPAIEPAVRFYREALDFETDGFVGQETGLLSVGGLRLWLSRSDGVAYAPEEASIGINFQVVDLEVAAARVEAAGGTAGEVQPFPLGSFFEAHDPWGNGFHVLHAPDGPPLTDEVGIFNIGWDTDSYARSEAFLTALGFRVYSRDYLPTALPYEPSGTTALVTHEYATHAASEQGRHNALVLEVDDLEAAGATLREHAPALSPIRPSAYGRVATLRSPANLELLLVERSPAQLAFERFRSLKGPWHGESSQGWEARIEFEVIARGSTVIQRSNFAAHPMETMVTAFHRDGKELVLTHYCVAGNQPRLVARDFGEEDLAFVWRDGTNLVSRDEGHMDSVRYRFPDPDKMTARWSWYQDGTERWMEEIHYERYEE